MVSRGRHPKKPINDALDELDPEVFVVEQIHRGHRWGVVRHVPSGDTIAIWSTPRVPEDTANAIRRFVRRHTESGEQR